MIEEESFYITFFERIMRELNIVACAFECQLTEKLINSNPTVLLHSEGRYLAGIYFVKSNREMMKLQEYINHYTERFETASNTVLVEKELLEIHKKANDIIKYYNKNLTSNSDIFKQFHDNKPKDFKKESEYFKEHRGFIVVHDLYPSDIVFGTEDWSEDLEFNYTTTNRELAFFCEKLIKFINKFDISIEFKQSDESFVKSNTGDKPKIPAKYYALYHWILIEIGRGKTFERNQDDKFPKNDIEKFAEERYTEASKAMFYREFIRMDLTRKDLIAIEFGKGFKDVILSISNNDAKISNYLKKFPN